MSAVRPRFRIRPSSLLFWSQREDRPRPSTAPNSIMAAPSVAAFIRGIFLVKVGNQSKLLSTATGEVVSVDHSAARLDKSDEICELVLEGAGSDQDGGSATMRVDAHTFLSMWPEVRDDGVVLVDGRSGEALDFSVVAAREHALQFDIAGAGSSSRLSIEVYEFGLARGGHTLFFVLRWLTSFLGATRKNFVGDSLPSWRNRVAYFLDFAPFAADEDAQFRESHLSKVKKFDAKGEPVPLSIYEDGAGTEFAASPFAVTILLVSWAAKGPRKTSTWSVDHAIVMARSEAALVAFLSKFITCELHHEACSQGIVCRIRIVPTDGIPCLDSGCLVNSEGGKALKRCESCKGGGLVPLHIFLKDMCVEHGTGSRGFVRREAARFMIGSIAGLISLVVEASRGDELWRARGLVQLEALRSARGFKRVTPTCKLALVQASSTHKGVGNIGQVLAAKNMIEGGDPNFRATNSLEYYRTERFAYLSAGLKAFTKATRLSLVCDGVSVGSDKLLNCVL